LDGAFRGTDAVRGGLLTVDQLRSSAWRRLFRDVYAHRDLRVTHEVRAVAAASLVVPDSVVTGCSAAVLWGVDLVGDMDEVELTVPPGRAAVRMKGIRLRRAGLRAADVERRRGVLSSTPEATACRVAASLAHEDAVVVVDQLVEAAIVDLEAIRHVAARMRGPGAARARAVSAAADGLAQSPQETRLRLLIGTSGLPAPIAQYRVVHEGRRVARVDFAWPERKVAVEYDGLWHAEPGQFAKDRRRLNRLREAGWTVVFVTAADMHRPAELTFRA
jgi:hypothetical protein